LRQHAKIRMQPSEKPFENGLVNTFFMRLYPRSPGPFPSPWPIRNVFAKIFWLSWKLECSILLEIIFHPQIMIPHEEINRNTTIKVLLVYPKHGWNLWDYGFIFEPKNQIISQKKELRSLLISSSHATNFVLLENSTQVLVHQNADRMQNKFFVG
jgi:hypothetical protein